MGEISNAIREILLRNIVEEGKGLNWTNNQVRHNNVDRLEGKVPKILCRGGSQEATNGQLHNVGEYWRLQYEGLHDVCFACGRYGLHEAGCPLKSSVSGGIEAGNGPAHSKEVTNEANNVLNILRVRGLELGCWWSAVFDDRLDHRGVVWVI